MFETRGVPSDPAASQISNLSDEDLRRIRRALGNMPYSAAVHTRQVEDVESLIVWLTGFAEVLREHARRDDVAEEELRMLRHQRDHVRNFLGLDDLLARLAERPAPEDNPGFMPNL
jgi:hypothetical protein